jgi:mono/diheme cytochrome c family protein
MPVLIAIPLWAFLYPNAFTTHKKATVIDPLVIGQQVYTSAGCSGCHGANGEGGLAGHAPALHGGQSKLTFPNIQDQINWVKNGSQSLPQGRRYGDPNRAGGQHMVNENPGDMPAFASTLSPIQIQDVVQFEREKL